MRNLSPEGCWIVLNLLSASLVLFPLCHSCELALPSNSLDWVLHQFIPFHKVWFHYFAACWQRLGLSPPSYPFSPTSGPADKKAQVLPPLALANCASLSLCKGMLTLTPCTNHREPRPISYPRSLKPLSDHFRSLPCSQKSLCMWVVNLFILWFGYSSDGEEGWCWNGLLGKTNSLTSSWSTHLT